MTVPTNEQKILANTHNEPHFISVLCEEVKAPNISVKQVDNDVDVLIIKPAIEQFNTINVTIIVRENVDLLILLTARVRIGKIYSF